jgi:hypothetical protein
VNLSKIYKQAEWGPSDELYDGSSSNSVSVSHIIGTTNSVLFDDHLFSGTYIENQFVF